MRYRILGGTGIEVSELCLGSMMFGAWGNTDEAECHRIVSTALDAGVNFVDTADVYAFGESEEILGRALKGRRDDVVLVSKFHNQMPGRPLDRNRRGNSRLWITRAVEDSLRRLRTDHLDVYLVHRPDPRTGIEETLGALSDLVRAGKVRAIGTSSFPAEEIVEAQWAARRAYRERFTVEQLSYSVLARHAEAAALPTAQRHRMGVMVWSPLSGGWLTGKYRAYSNRRETRARGPTVTTSTTPTSGYASASLRSSRNSCASPPTRTAHSSSWRCGSYSPIPASPRPSWARAPMTSS